MEVSFDFGAVLYKEFVFDLNLISILASTIYESTYFLELCFEMYPNISNLYGSYATYRNDGKMETTIFYLKQNRFIVP